MARLAFKPDSSFFRKIAIGAIGTRAVCADLAGYGHEVVELERGSTDTKLWKDVKRKRVRIPDLVCTKCGLRVESRAKTSADLSMSHSPSDEARAWDFGMVDRDVVAFPVCVAAEETYWCSGRLKDALAYWRERNWVHWEPRGRINYFTVEAFRSTPSSRSSTKGVTEGSETIIAWNARFSSRTGRVDAVSPDRVTVRRASDGHRHSWKVAGSLQPRVIEGEEVLEHQVLASDVPPLPAAQLACPGRLVDRHIAQLLQSRERTLRFTGVKLARLRGDRAFQADVSALSDDADEDVYVRLEAASYLTSVCGMAAHDLFRAHCDCADRRTQLEAVIALGEAGTDDAVTYLSCILDDNARPYFLRSAAAWSLSRVNKPWAFERLIRAFSDVDRDVREEALDGIIAIGGPAVPLLAAGLRATDSAIAAGCAESLRRQRDLPDHVIDELVQELRTGTNPVWTTWLLGHLPRERVASVVVGLQPSAPHLHYAITVLWAFAESWIARRWESLPHLTEEGDGHG